MSNTPSDADIVALAISEGIKLRTGAGVVRLARAVLAKWGQPAQAAEPVAWAFKYDDGTWHDPSTTEHSSGMRPLFAAHQPVAREHLTDEMVLAALRVMSPATFKHGLHPLEKDGPMIRQRMEIETKLVRKMLDAAHGIKGGQHG